MSNDSASYESIIGHLVRPLVGNPDQVVVLVNEYNSGVTALIETHPDDVGRVIGKGGSTIGAIRAIVEHCALSRGDCVVVDLKND